MEVVLGIFSLCGMFCGAVVLGALILIGLSLWFDRKKWQ